MIFHSVVKVDEKKKVNNSEVTGDDGGLKKWNFFNENLEIFKKNFGTSRNFLIAEYNLFNLSHPKNFL